MERRRVAARHVWMEFGLCVLGQEGARSCGCGNASEVVAKELAKRAEEAPMGRTLLVMRRLVRLIGEGVLLGCRDVFC